VLEEGTTEGDASGPEYCDYRYKGAHGFWGHLPGQRVDSADHGLGLTVAPPAREPMLLYASAGLPAAKAGKRTGGRGGGGAATGGAKAKAKVRGGASSSSSSSSSSSQPDGIDLVIAWRGEHPPRSVLSSRRVVIVDSEAVAKGVFIWVGEQASNTDRAAAFPCAQAYLARYNRPPTTPITRINEGAEPEAFLAVFGSAASSTSGRGQACCVVS
jgi:hypothetical protein